MAKAISMSSEILAVCLMMIVPGLIGYGVDQWLGTVFVFTLLGLAFGMFGAVYQLIRLVSAMASDDDLSKSEDNNGQSQDK